MPPQNFDSDSETEAVPSKKAQHADEVDEMDEDEEDVVTGDLEEAEEEEEDEYVVEAIKDHKFEGKVLMLLVKWKGYEKKSDMTWEPEENCAGAKDVVKEYFASLGGRPKYQPPAPASAKRGRASTGAATPAASSKKKKTTPSNESPAPADEPKWRPPAGSWEDEIQAIDTIEKTEKGLICYIQWGNGKKSQHEVHTVYKKAPQRMLKFYEQHLVFKESSTTNNAYKDDE
ncbi:hypothetical protein DFH27DRAFT_523063 [Peziza echinospora]|nr:hypothetical protein DFH27DRAFT_523063 [Peziza echinospora]